jgi:hypothetical protein
VITIDPPDGLFELYELIGARRAHRRVHPVPGDGRRFCSESLLGKARTGGLLDLRLHDPREHTTTCTARSTTRRSAGEPAC